MGKNYTVGNSTVTTDNTNAYTPTQGFASMFNPANITMESISNMTPEQQSLLGSSGLTFDSSGTASFDKSMINNDYLKSPISDKSLGSINTSSINWGMDGWGGFGLSVGQLGLGLASYLDNKKTADKQRHLMDQQAKQNDYNYNKTIADNKHIQQIFNPNNQ